MLCIYVKICSKIDIKKINLHPSAHRKHTKTIQSQTDSKEATEKSQKMWETEHISSPLEGCLSNQEYKY